jgi:hypothetical protein
MVAAPAVVQVGEAKHRVTVPAVLIYVNAVGDHQVLLVLHRALSIIIQTSEEYTVREEVVYVRLPPTRS